MMPSYLTGAFRLVSALRGEHPQIYYLNIPKFPNYTRIVLGLFFSFTFFFPPVVQSAPMSSLAAQSADPVPVPVSSSQQFPGGTNPLGGSR